MIFLFILLISYCISTFSSEIINIDSSQFTKNQWEYFHNIINSITDPAWNHRVYFGRTIPVGYEKFSLENLIHPIHITEKNTPEQNETIINYVIGIFQICRNSFNDFFEDTFKITKTYINEGLQIENLNKASDKNLFVTISSIIDQNEKFAQSHKQCVEALEKYCDQSLRNNIKHYIDSFLIDTLCKSGTRNINKTEIYKLPLTLKSMFKKLIQELFKTSTGSSDTGLITAFHNSITDFMISTASNQEKFILKLYFDRGTLFVGEDLKGTKGPKQIRLKKEVVQNRMFLWFPINIATEISSDDFVQKVNEYVRQVQGSKVIEERIPGVFIEQKLALQELNVPEEKILETKKPIQKIGISKKTKVKKTISKDTNSKQILSALQQWKSAIVIGVTGTIITGVLFYLAKKHPEFFSKNRIFRFLKRKRNV